MKLSHWIRRDVVDRGRPARAELPPLIPRDVLFGNPDKSGVQISPDGKHLAYLASDDKNVLQVWVRPIDKAEAKKITSDEKPRHPPVLLAARRQAHPYMQDVGGDENFLFASELATGKTRDLTPFDGVRAGSTSRTSNRTRSWSVSTSGTRSSSTSTASRSRPGARNSTPRTPEPSSAGPPTRTSWFVLPPPMNPKTGGYDVMVREKPGRNGR